jgi:hypothetical protein
MKSKHYTGLVLFLGIGIFLLKVSTLIILDPLQIYHKSWDGNENFIKGMRFQAAGIINNYPFDSIVLGSSMAENFSPNEASKVFNNRFINLSLSGSNFPERSLVLNHALKNKKLENVIISLDGFSPIGEYRDDFPVSNFDFLYNESPFDDIKIYLTNKYLKFAICRIGIVFNNVQQCRSKFRTLESIVEWGSDNEQNRRFGGLNKWLEAATGDGQIRDEIEKINQSISCIKNACNKISDNVKDTMTDFEQGKSSFDLYILKTAKEHPETEFHVFFPPYSRLLYAIWSQETPKLFELYLSTIMHVVEQSESISNLHVHGFDHLQFLDSISNYKDPRHFHPDFSSKILYWMKNGKHELSNKTINQYLSKINSLASTYDLTFIGNSTNQYLQSSDQ